MESEAFKHLSSLVNEGKLAVTQPKVLWDLFLTFSKLTNDSKVNIVSQLLKISRRVLHNPHVILHDSVTCDSEGNTIHIMGFLIELLFSQNSPEVTDRILDLISYLVTNSWIQKSDVEKLFQLITRKRTTQDDILIAIRALSAIFGPSQNPPPHHFFYFSGKNSGIEINVNRVKGFPFTRGLTACMWLRCEEFISEIPPTLFSFVANNGIAFEAHLDEFKLIYKVTKPDSPWEQEVALCELIPEKWLFIAIEHDITNGVVRAIVNGEDISEVQLRLDPPYEQLRLVKGSLFTEFTGQATTVCFFNEVLTAQKIKSIFAYYNFGPHGHDALRGMHRVLDKSLTSKMVLFYHPLRVMKDIAYEGVAWADGKLLPQTGVKSKASTRISFLGGVSSLLPICTKITKSEILVEYFRLIYLCLKDRPENQMEARSLKLFKALTESLLLIDADIIDLALIDVILDIINNVMPQLKDQIAVHMLWSLELWTHCQVDVQLKVLSFLLSIYSKNPKSLNKAVGVQSIMDFLMEYYGSMNYGNIERQIEILVDILKVILLSGGETVASNIKYIVTALYQPVSLCIQTQLISLIKYLLSDRKGDIISAQPKVFAQHLADANGLDMLLNLANKATFEIRTSALVCIDLYISNTGSLSEREQNQIMQFSVGLFKSHQTKRASEASGGFGSRSFRLVSDDIEEEEIPDVSQQSIGGLQISPTGAGSVSQPLSITRGKKGFNFDFDDPKPFPEPPKSFKFDLSLDDDFEESKEEPGLDLKIPFFSPSNAQDEAKPIKSFSKMRRNRPGINLNTEEINEQFPVGGEQGVSQTNDMEKLFQDAVDMAKKCIQYMREELTVSQETTFYPLPPAVGNRPLSVRGDTKISFNNTVRLSNTNKPPPMEDIMSEGSLNSSNPVFSPSIRHFDEESLEEENLYSTVFEIILRRPLGKNVTIEEYDKVVSSFGLTLLIKISPQLSEDFNHRALQVFKQLTQQSPENISILMGNTQWHHWLLSLLLSWMNSKPNMLEFGSQFHDSLLQHAMEHLDDGWRYLKSVLIWDGLVSDSSKVQAKFLEWELFESAFCDLPTGQSKPDLSCKLWKNLVHTSFLFEDLLLHSKKLRNDSEDAFIPKWLNSILEFELSSDLKLLDVFSNLLAPIFDIFPQEDQEHEYLAQLIQDGSAAEKMRSELPILFFEPSAELGDRSSFLKVVVTLFAIALRQSTNNCEYWIEYMKSIFKYILLVSETCKGEISSKDNKTLLACGKFILGFIYLHIEEDIGEEKREALLDGICGLLKCLFKLYQSQEPRREKTQKFSLSLSIPPPPVVSAIVNKLLMNGQLLHAEELARMGQTDFVEVYDLVQTEEWQVALSLMSRDSEVQFMTVDKIDSNYKHRKAEITRYEKELKVEEDAASDLSRTISDRIMASTAESNESETERKNEAEILNDGKIRARKQLYFRIIKSLSVWRGVWSFPKNYSYEIYPFTNFEGARPFLKLKTENTGLQPIASNRAELNIPSINYLDKIIKKYELDQLADLEDEEDDFAFTLNRKHPKRPPTFESGGVFEKECVWVNCLHNKYGLLQIFTAKKETFLRFILQEEVKEKFDCQHIPLLDFKPSENKANIKEWSLKNLKLVLQRRYNLKQTALEIFFHDGFSFLLNFLTTDECDKVASVLLQQTSMPLASIKDLKPSELLLNSAVVDRWVNWEISNFEYLMFLNNLAGRSYHDLTQYPIFPWVLTDFTSNRLDLSRNDIYRDLRVPVSAPYHMKSLKRQYETSRYHHRSYYSNLSKVLSYLSDIPPYSEAHESKQMGPTFSSILDAFQTSQQSDSSELIPEYYTLPELFTGKELPPWANNNPHEFIRIHREALESDYVSENLHNWIDLIFGQQMTGKKAIGVMNCFHFMTYDTAPSLGMVHDSNDRRKVEKAISEVGLVPTQLFKVPHPARGPRPTTTSAISRSSNLKIYRPISKQSQGSQVTPSNYLELSGRAIIKATLSGDRIFALRNNGNMVIYRWWQSSIQDSRTPFTCAIEKERKIGRDYHSALVETKDRSTFGFNAPIIISHGLIIQGGYWDGRLTFQKLSDTEQLRQNWNHSSTITCLSIDVEQKYAITGSKDGDSLIWVIEGHLWQAKWHYIDHEDEVTSVCISDELNKFASCSLDGTCNIYTLRKGRILKVIRHTNSIGFTNVIFSKHGIILFSSIEKLICLYSLNGDLLHTTRETSKHIVDPLIVPSTFTSESLIYGNEKGEIFIKNASDLQLVKKLSLGKSVPLTSLILTSNQKHLLASCGEGELTVITDPTF